MADVPPIMRHIESHFGQIDPTVGTWQYRQADGETIQAVAFRNHPRRGAVTICSLGLGHHTLCSPRGHIRQELLMACRANQLGTELVALLPIVARDVIGRHVALSSGQVLGPAGPLVPGSRLQALLCLEPLLYSPALRVCAATEPPTEFVWLVPLTPAEGREAAEGVVDQLLAQWDRDRVDLLDWYRAEH